MDLARRAAPKVPPPASGTCPMIVAPRPLASCSMFLAISITSTSFVRAGEARPIRPRREDVVLLEIRGGLGPTVQATRRGFGERSGPDLR